jgi:hypothetical protein
MEATLDRTPGRAVVTPPPGTAEVTSEELRAALYDSRQDAKKSW